MTSSDYKLFKAEGMREAIAMVIAATGSSGREPQQVADNLVLANLKGHDSHGIGMVPRYVDSFLEGGLKVNQQPLSRSMQGRCWVSMARRALDSPSAKRLLTWPLRVRKSTVFA